MEDESAEYQFCESRQLNMSTLRMTAEAKVRSNPMCIITWLVPRAGKMKRILCSDWLPERGRWVYRACSGFPALVPQEKSSLGHIINRSIIDQNDRGRQYPTHMSFLARAPQVSPLDTMPPLTCLIPQSHLSVCAYFLFLMIVKYEICIS